MKSKYAVMLSSDAKFEMEAESGREAVEKVIEQLKSDPPFTLGLFEFTVGELKEKVVQ